MNPRRRRWLQLLTGVPWMGIAQAQGIGRDALSFPRDHGAHLNANTEWWYATGWIGSASDGIGAPTHGFQITFFRSRTGLAADNTSRFAARQLLFAHAAVTQLAPARHLHDQRIVRWNGAADAPTGHARSDAG